MPSDADVPEGLVVSGLVYRAEVRLSFGEPLRLIESGQLMLGKSLVVTYELRRLVRERCWVPVAYTLDASMRVKGEDVGVQVHWWEGTSGRPNGEIGRLLRLFAPDLGV